LDPKEQVNEQVQVQQELLAVAGNGDHHHADCLELGTHSSSSVVAHALGLWPRIYIYIERHGHGTRKSPTHLSGDVFRNRKIIRGQLRLHESN